MKKLIIVAIALIVVVLAFNTFVGNRGYHRRGFVSDFTHSAVRSAGAYTGYKVAKGLLGGEHHRERRHHYGY